MNVPSLGWSDFARSRHPAGGSRTYFAGTDEELLERALDLAAQIAAHPALAVSATKHCVNVGLRDGFEAGLAQERELRVETGTGPDAVEGRNAFLEKREPRFNLA